MEERLALAAGVRLRAVAPDREEAKSVSAVPAVPSK